MSITAYRELVSGDHESLVQPYFVVEDDPAEYPLTIELAETSAIVQFQRDWPGVAVTHVRHAELNGEGPNVRRITVEYRKTKLRQLTPQPMGSARFGFSFKAPAEEFFYSLSTVQTAGGFDNGGASGAINVQCTADGTVVAGVRITPNETDYARYVVPVSAVTRAWRNQITSIMGHVNADTFYDRPAGSVRFVAARLDLRTDDEAELYLGYEEKPNQASVDFDGITLTNVEGHDYAWGYYVDEMPTFAVGESVAMTKKAIAAYVERLFPRSSFAPLVI